MLVEALSNRNTSNELSKTTVPYLELDDPNASLDSGENITTEIEQEPLNTRYGFQINTQLALGVLVKKGVTSEVIMHPAVYPIPLSAVWMKGIINLRGNLIPVFDLDCILNPNSTANDSNTVLVIDKGADSVGIIIDRLPTALKDSGKKHKTGKHQKWLHKYIVPAFEANEINWYEFDYKNFFLDIKKNRHTL